LDHDPVLSLVLSKAFPLTDSKIADETSWLKSGVVGLHGVDRAFETGPSRPTSSALADRIARDARRRQSASRDEPWERVEPAAALDARVSRGEAKAARRARAVVEVQETDEKGDRRGSREEAEELQSGSEVVGGEEGGEDGDREDEQTDRGEGDQRKGKKRPHTAP
jgi:hypothetical protein